MSIVLLFVMAFLIYVAIHHKSFFPRVRNPEELYARLQGDYSASSDGDVSVGDYSDVSEIDEDLALGEELYHRRKAQEAEDSRNEVMHEEYPLGGMYFNPEEPPTSPHEKQN